MYKLSKLIDKIEQKSIELHTNVIPLQNKVSRLEKYTLNLRDENVRLSKMNNSMKSFVNKSKSKTNLTNKQELLNYLDSILVEKNNIKIIKSLKQLFSKSYDSIAELKKNNILFC